MEVLENTFLQHAQEINGKAMVDWSSFLEILLDTGMIIIPHKEVLHSDTLHILERIKSRQGIVMLRPSSLKKDSDESKKVSDYKRMQAKLFKPVAFISPETRKERRKKQRK